MGVNGIYGLSGSGIDVESMVKVGMLSKQKQYDKMQQTYTKNEWTKQAYNEIYNKLTTFSTSTLTPYKLSSNMSAKSAVSSDESAVTATANGNAVLMNHKVTVNHLSSSAYLVATDSLETINEDPSELTGSVQLQDYIFKKSTHRATDNTLVVTGSDGKIISDSNEDTTVNLKDTAFEFTVSDGTTTATLKYTYGELLGLTQNSSGTIKDKDNAKTFNDFVSDFNALGTNIKASYDSVNGKFSFYNKTGGAENTINFTMSSNETVANTTATFFKGMKLAQSLEGQLYGANGAAFDNDSKANYIGSYNDNVTAAQIATSEAIEVDGEIATTDTTLDDLIGGSYLTEAWGLSINGTEISSLTYTINENNDDDVVDGFTYTAADGTVKTGEEVTIGDLIDAINAESDTTNVVASFEDGKLTLTSTVNDNTGEITLDGNTEFLDKFDLADVNAVASDDDDDEVEEGAPYLTAKAKEGTLSFGVAGENGSAIIDGVEYNDLTDNSVNAFGVIYKFHSTTVDESGTAQPVSVNIEQDIDSIVDRVKSFVEDYNKLLGSIYDKYNEKQYKDYTPLTASQKETMKDEQIEKWEEKAKSGLLYHDQTLNKITTKMRSAVSNPIEGLTGKYTSAYSLGISTTGLYGQLTLDEDKLRAALNEDSEAVYKVFSTLSKDDDYDQNGISQRLSDVMVDATKLIKGRAGTDDSTNDDSDLGTLMRELQNKMSDFKKLLDAFETKLYKKYDAMEVALASLGTQLSFITGGQ